MKEPTRLCESDDFPAALRGAFRALEQEAPNAETVLRVQRALQALPAASSGAAVASTIGSTKLWLVTTLIAGAAAFGVLTQGRFGAPRAAREVHEQVQAARAAETTALPANQPAPSRSVPDVVHAPAAPEAPDEAERADSPAPQLADEQERRQTSTPATAKGGDLATAPRARARSEAHAKDARVNSSAQRSTVAAARSGHAGNAFSLAPADESPSLAAPPAPAQEPAPLPEPSATPRAKSDEAALLAQAKRLSSSDPSAALRELEALGQRYPAGTFVQERELLAIQLHQRLGHAPVVQQLKRQFLERFPNSVYRRALPP